MNNHRTLLRLGENTVVVKTDTPVDGEPRLYVASSMADQIGASLNPAQARGLRDTLNEWLEEVDLDRQEGGWKGPRADGKFEFTLVGPRPVDFDPPAREGFEPYWVNVVGDRYTTWIYRPIGGRQ